MKERERAIHILSERLSEKVSEIEILGERLYCESVCIVRV